MDDLEDFKEFIRRFALVNKTRTLDEEHKCGDPSIDTWEEETFRLKDDEGDWWYSTDDMPSLDFNRELCAPGKTNDFPAGAIGIRCDDDFWICAVLPWRFNKIPVEQIVPILWPNIKASYNPDSIAV